jgi:ABC-type transport system involved in multi-copper enzyme maturation permease subunit
MIWLTWRQFRAQAFTVLAILAAVTLVAVITGLQMRHTYTADLATCAAQNDCDTVLRDDIMRVYAPVLQLVQLLVTATPALIGIFWGAPLISREIETGTHQLAWNQTVTRTRWLAVKLTGVGLASIATAGLLSYLLTWWAGPLDQINGDRFGAMTFSSRDVVPLAYAVFAFALGTAAGLLMRRTITAMAVTLAVFVGVQILVPTAIRPNLLPSTTATFPINQTTMSQSNGLRVDGGEFTFDGLSLPHGVWLISQNAVRDASGQVAQMDNYAQCFPGPDGFRVKGPDNPFPQIGACLASFNLHETVTYQPASHYWPLQWVETGIFLGLTMVAFGFCFWWIRRRQN